MRGKTKQSKKRNRSAWKRTGDTEKPLNAQRLKYEEQGAYKSV